MQLAQRYAILTLMQAVLGGVIAAAVFVGYQTDPASIKNPSLAISIAGLGALGAIYYLSVHQMLKVKRLKQSAIAMSAITALNVILVITVSGGLDSPYYALWLLGIVIAGIFGTVATIVAVVITLIYFGFEFYSNANTSGYFVAHFSQLAITLGTAGIAEWIHLALGRDKLQKAQVTKLSGQLNQESIKSNVLMESVGEGVLVINSKRQIQLFNPAAVRMTGWDDKSAHAIDYRLVLDLHNAKGEKITDQEDPFGRVWQTGKGYVCNDLTMQTKGGKKVAISLSLSPIFGADKKVSGGIALFRDISQELEVQRQRNEFISTASHEMRTPVAAIEGYLSLAMNPAVATVDDRAKNYLEKAHNSTQHLGELFRDLLSVTKVEDGAKTEVTEVFDLTTVVKDTVSDMQFAAKKKNLELQFGTDQVRGSHTVMPIYAVKGNPQRLREVVMNLIENALKFTTEGSIRVTIGGTTDTVTVGVSDTGIGIAEEDIPHLFQKFYRIDNSRTRTIGGTGLGLYLCRSIVELLGGRMWVESKVREGSTFKFSLPRQASDLIAAKPAPIAPAAPATVAKAPITPDAPVNPEKPEEKKLVPVQ